MDRDSPYMIFEPLTSFRWAVDFPCLKYDLPLWCEVSQYNWNWVHSHPNLSTLVTVPTEIIKRDMLTLAAEEKVKYRLCWTLNLDLTQARYLFKPTYYLSSKCT